jgi:hypothetical protein
MTTQELRKLIREESQKVMTEQSNNVLGKNFYVQHVTGKTYVLFYSEMAFETDLKQIQSIIAKLYALIKKKNVAEAIGLQSVLPKNTIFALDNDVCIGIDFKSYFNKNEMDDSVGLAGFYL